MKWNATLDLLCSTQLLDEVCAEDYSNSNLVLHPAQQNYSFLQNLLELLRYLMASLL